MKGSELGFVVGVFPTLCMLGASMLLAKVAVSPKVSNVHVHQLRILWYICIVPDAVPCSCLSVFVSCSIPC